MKTMEKRLGKLERHEQAANDYFLIIVDSVDADGTWRGPDGREIERPKPGTDGLVMHRTRPKES